MRPTLSTSLHPLFVRGRWWYSIWARGAPATEDKRANRREGSRSFVLALLLSPELNPIEEAFSKVKALVRKEGARVREALIEAIGRALAAVTPEDAAGWFAHAGYWPQDQPL